MAKLLSFFLLAIISDTNQNGCASGIRLSHHPKDSAIAQLDNELEKLKQTDQEAEREAGDEFSSVMANIQIEAIQKQGEKNQKMYAKKQKKDRK